MLTVLVTENIVYGRAFSSYLPFIKNGNSMNDKSIRIKQGIHTSAVSSKHKVKSGNESEYQVNSQSFKRMLKIKQVIHF